MHRMAGYILFIAALVIWWIARKSANRTIRASFNMMMAVMALQVVLGIVTVIYSAPVHLAITHQFLAVILWATILRARFMALYPKPQSVRMT
jgi:cytochrome c oxidase assembly protein subunit 15